MENIPDEDGFRDSKMNIEDMENDLIVLSWWKIGQWIKLTCWSLW